MQRLRKRRWSTEEYTGICIRVLICDRSEHSIPVGSPEVGRSPQAGDRIALRANILDEDIVHVVLLESGSEIDGDLDPVLRVLLLDGVQERVEPFCGAEVTDDPDEVNLGETGGLRVVEAVHPVPDGLEDRGEGCNTNACTNEKYRLVLVGVSKATFDKCLAGTRTFKKSSEALPNGPSTMTRGSTLLTGGLAAPVTCLPLFSSLASKSQPRALAKSEVKSPTIRM